MSKMIDHSDKVLSALEGAIPAALNAMGIKGVNLTLYQMRHGFGKPIRQTGDLQRDVSYEVDVAGRQVHVGNSLNYARYVHEGTRKMAGRPYLTNALVPDERREKLAKVAEAEIKKAFK